MFALASLVMICLATPQDPNKVLATYELRGEQATVTSTDVALEMAFHLRRNDRGRQGCNMLVDYLITRKEAKRLNLMPTRADAQKFWKQLQDQLVKAGHKPEDYAAVRNTSEEQWLEDLSVQIAQERLVRNELGLAANESVGGDMLKLWLSETRQRFSVETDPDKLPVGTAAQVDGTPIALIDLGFLLLRTSEDFERDKFIRQVVYLQTIESMARAKLISITPTDLDREVASRREQVKRDPRRGGVSYDQMLQTTGMTIESIKAMRIFRSHVLLDKLTLLAFPKEKLATELKADRQAVLDLVGPRRRIGAIFIRALKTPNAIIKRSFEDAMSHLKKVRERIAKDGFAATAAIETELGSSKRDGGDLGWHRRGSKELPANIVQAAFEMKMTEVSMPLRTKDGCYVITVLDREPIPKDVELLSRLQIVRGEQLSRDILAKAKLEMKTQDTANRDAKNSGVKK